MIVNALRLRRCFLRKAHMPHDLHNARIGAERLEFRSGANISERNIAPFQSFLQELYGGIGVPDVSVETRYSVW